MLAYFQPRALAVLTFSNVSTTSRRYPRMQRLNQAVIKPRYDLLRLRQKFLTRVTQILRSWSLVEFV
jgi:hypothetical protein